MAIFNFIKPLGRRAVFMIKLKSFKISTLFFAAIFLTLGLSISGQSLLAAWVAPLANPSTCLTGNPGCDAPINTGPAFQTTNGALWIVNSPYPVNPYGLIVEQGNVGIGVMNPGAKLEVSGQIKITGGTPGAGKVLTSDAAGLASWSAPAGGMGGSGTANYVPKFTAASTLGNSLIYDNGSSVGIGSTDFTSLTGSGNLKVNKDLRVGGVIRGDASGNVIIQLGN